MRRRASLAALVAAACARGVARGGAAVERTPEAICASLRRPANATRARAPFELVGVESFSQQAEVAVIVVQPQSQSAQAEEQPQEEQEPSLTPPLPFPGSQPIEPHCLPIGLSLVPACEPESQQSLVRELSVWDMCEKAVKKQVLPFATHFEFQRFRNE